MEKDNIQPVKMEDFKQKTKLESESKTENFVELNENPVVKLTVKINGRNIKEVRPPQTLMEPEQISDYAREQVGIKFQGSSKIRYDGEGGCVVDFMVYDERLQKAISKNDFFSKIKLLLSDLLENIDKDTLKDKLNIVGLKEEELEDFINEQ